MNNNVKLLIDFIHRLSMHHSMWFNEVQSTLGQQAALNALKKCYDLSIPLQLNRIAKTLNLNLDLNNSNFLSGNLQISDEQLSNLQKAIAINWLANDGIWFQAIETEHGMIIAKKCNDACWGKFSPFEAWSIRNLLNIPDQPGLAGLMHALQFRLYAFINKQSIVRENDNTLLFYMNDCRVQSARKKKNLPDYPCKSAGVIEYTSFATAIDSRIKTECISCPPDKHPDEWFCGWKYTI